MSFFTCYRSCFSTSCYSWSTFIRYRSSWLFSCTSNCRSRCSFRTSIYCRGLSVSFFTCYRSCFGTSSTSSIWRFSMSFFSRASRWNFSVSFFISYRSCRLFSSSVRRSFSMSFFSCTSCYCRSTFSTSRGSFCVSFFTCYRSRRLYSFSASSYSRSWGLSMSFFASRRSRCFSASSYCRLFCVSFFTCYRSCRLSCFSTSCCSRSTFSTSSGWGLSMSFTSSKLIYYRSCRLFSSTSCWSSWSITCLICWFRCIFSSTIICINHEVRI